MQAAVAILIMTDQAVTSALLAPGFAQCLPSRRGVVIAYCVSLLRPGRLAILLAPASASMFLDLCP
jgi:hypothetical protein